MSDDEYDSNICPLCVEEMDLSDKNFLPCPCGYRVCMWCWHHIRENLNGLCPACRTPYNSDPHLFSAVDRQEIVKKNRERKQKEKYEKKVESQTKPVVGKTTVDRKHLHNFRVVQRNLVYILGLPSNASTSEILRKAEYFGQYGKIVKVVVHQNPNLSHSTVSAYVTFAHKEDAQAAIQALDGFWIDGHPLRASFGTTKYCNNFIRNVPCQNPECVYLHDLGEEDDRFTKEEIQSGHSKLPLVPNKDQTLVTGQGGPSGSGKRPTGETILPQPTFLQDINALPKPMSLSRNVSTSVTTSTASVQESKDTSVNESSTSPTQELSKSRNGKPVAASKQAKDSVDDLEVVATQASTSTVKQEPESSDQSKSKVSNHKDAAPEVIVIAGANNKLNAPRGGFNGVTWNAVFPVPASSLTISVWATVSKDCDEDLSRNPFSKSLISFADLMDLTLPPVDAISASGSRTVEAPYSYSKLNNTVVGSDSSTRSFSVQNQQPVVGSNHNSGAGFHALRQLFPGVNLSYGSAATGSSASAANINRGNV